MKPSETGVCPLQYHRDLIKFVGYSVRPLQYSDDEGTQHDAPLQRDLAKVDVRRTITGTGIDEQVPYQIR